MATKGDNDEASLKRLRKRDADRRFHRKKREHTKSRLQYLEDLADQLREQDSTGCFGVLMKKLADVEEQRDEYKRKVEAIEVIMGGGMPKIPCSIPRSPPGQPEAMTSTAGNIRCEIQAPEPLPVTSSSARHSSYRLKHSSNITVPVDGSASSTCLPINPDVCISSELQQIDSIDLRPASANMQGITPVTDLTHELCGCQHANISLNPRMGPNKWKITNQRLGQWMNDPLTYRLSETVKDREMWHDTPIRGIVDGWSKVERRGSFHPGWRLLRSIDELLFEESCAKIERLAIMVAMGMLLASHLNPSSDTVSQLPSYYQEDVTPVALTQRHSYAIEYFAWPGIRAKFIASEHRYCDNKFWTAFVRGLKFQWINGLADCYLEKNETGLYRLSPAFYGSIMDVKRWTMGPDFFEVFPELRSDIPARDTVPKAIHTASYMDHGRYMEERRRRRHQHQRRTALLSPPITDSGTFTYMHSNALPTSRCDNSQSESRDEAIVSLEPAWTHSPESANLFQSWMNPGLSQISNSGIDGLMYLIGEG